MTLEGKVALVAGGTRGAGRGIAVELGAAGATVYVTGRTTRERQSEYARPETIEETAELVSASGGNGIAVRVDHLVADEVKSWSIASAPKRVVSTSSSMTCGAARISRNGTSPSGSMISGTVCACSVSVFIHI
jgi:NAD(P)-dependent dehydrogenase (short-subunit alcohol dehydrogenase family)